MDRQPKIDPDKLSELLIVGFVKHWPMSKVLLTAMLSDGKDWKEVGPGIHQAAPFMPKDYWQYRTPCRAYIVAEWPKLAAWLYKHESDGASVLSVAPKVRGLVSRGMVQKNPDHNELYATRRKLRAATTSYRNSRDIFKTNQRSAWNVCK